MSAGLRCRALVRAELAAGATRFTTLRSGPPVTLRATAGGMLYLAASAAGPLGGDEVDVEVEVGAGARLEVRTVAATLLLPGPGDAPSTTTQQVTVGEGAELHWLPEPAVAVRGCDHRTVTRIDLAAGARLLWREEVLLGRHGEKGGSVLQRLHIDRAGAPLLRTEHAIGTRWPGSEGPAGSGGWRAVGVVVLVGAEPASMEAAVAPPGGEAVVAWCPLGTDAGLVSAVAKGARALAAALDGAVRRCGA
ncbi:MAG: urease accessory protein UreD [Acidimicrobiales bacterium]